MLAGSGVFADSGIGKHIIRLHHTGVVLPNEEKARHFMGLLGLQEDYQGYVKAYDSNLIFTKHDATVGAFEFILPISGVLTEFNKGKGGIAHVAFEVDDIEACSNELKAMGIEMLEAKAVEGTEEIIVNFIRPKYTDGILVELIQTIGEINYNFKF